MFCDVKEDKFVWLLLSHSVACHRQLIIIGSQSHAVLYNWLAWMKPRQLR